MGNDNALNNSAVVKEITKGNSINLTRSLVFLFISVTIAFGLGENISIPIKSLSEFFRWLCVIVFFIVSFTFFMKINWPNIMEYLAYRLDRYAQKERGNSQVNNLAKVGTIAWVLAIFLKEGNLVIPLLLFGTITMAWAVMIFFEDTSIYKNLISYTSTKVVFSFFFASFSYWATVTTFSQINMIFGIEASLFPFTIVIGIFINVFKVISQLAVILVPITMLLTFLSVLTAKHQIWDSSRQVIIQTLFMLSVVLLILQSVARDENFTKNQLIRVAQATDMNSNHHCKNDVLIKDEKKLPVIFIGPNSSMVLFKDGNNFDIVKCFPTGIETE
ncbi:hypothetical protein PCIT_a2154 [Pseudoalteromonas citrea]|uniref:Uncharacterized protein n=2 Tax=Pseudoalteromonas citrea TaxID=43655 RepID=A0AAD4AJB0_9GAMM|nr:hypothetical protein [Pseudoalteromonas citrea]KAF7772143.1 hypothetical protein PCIT_a2154 [Pseudoalteromonas citrea]